METSSPTLTLDRLPLRRIPGRRYLYRNWVRGLALYVPLRMVAAGGSAGIDQVIGDATGSRWALEWLAVFVLFVVVGGLVWVFANRRRELALLRNLGVDTRVVLGLAIAPALGIELLVQWWIA